ncbi:MAG: hypothetical protein JXA30_20805 [Deltaproteobacteria bacterium]|nr:hypothetical protein [Deltaproteobacteria bacterium]
MRKEARIFRGYSTRVRLLGRIVAGTVLVFTLASTAGVSAQDEARKSALARELFNDSIALIETEQWKTAADKLQRALLLRWSPVIAYNLGFCLGHLGKLVQASELLQQVMRDESANAALKETADALLRELQPRIAKLAIRTEADQSNSEITLDGEALSPAAIGVAAPVDPGQHLIVARRDGAVVAQETVEIAEGSFAEVVLEMPGIRDQVVDEPREQPSTVEKPAIAYSVDEPATESTSSAPSISRNSLNSARTAPSVGIWTWVTLGTGAAALGGAFAFELVRQDAEETARRAPQIEYLDALETMKSYQTAARVFLGAGAALSLIGSVLLIFDLNRDAESATPRFGVSCTLRGCSGITRLTF